MALRSRLCPAQFSQMLIVQFGCRDMLVATMKEQAMGWKDHIDFDLHETVSDAVDEGYIEVGSPHMA